jgi:NAD(P)H-dependent FMN reductase
MTDAQPEQLAARHAVFVTTAVARAASTQRWNDKAAAFVSYGVNGGTRAVEHLRAILAEVKVAGVRTQVALSAFADFEHDESTDPSRQTVSMRGDADEPVVAEMLEELISWSEALRSTRTAGTVTTAA